MVTELASSQGGAIYIYISKSNGNSNFQLEMYNLTAYSNRVSSQGGAIYVHNYA